MKISEAQRLSYLEHALKLKPQERQKIAEYSEWLPQAIVNVHSHSNLPEHVVDVPSKTYNHMMSTFPSFTIDESHQIQQILHPKTNVQTIRFAHVFKGVDHKAANRYLLDNASRTNIAALYGLPEDVAYTVAMLADRRIKALKMYYSYLEPNATSIYEVFKPEILAAAQDHGVPIILHPPKIITESVQDILQVKQAFPNLKISIAHLGATKFDIPGLQEAYTLLAERTDVMLDTALNPSVEVTTRALQIFGAKRIMYGTDEPLNLLRSVPYIHPQHGPRITTEHRYHWQNAAEHAKYSHLAQKSIHSHWLTLDAIKAAIETLPEAEQEEAKQSLFYDNAISFFRLD